MFFEKKNQDNEFDFNSQNDLDFIEKETKIMSSHVIYTANIPVMVRIDKKTEGFRMQWR